MISLTIRFVVVLAAVYYLNTNFGDTSITVSMATVAAIFWVFMKYVVCETRVRNRRRSGEVSATPGMALRYRYARHEAGHAVVAHRLGARVLSVSIKPVGQTNGRTVWAWEEPESGREHYATVNHIAISAAGAFADRVGRLFSTGGHLDDHSLILGYALSASIYDPLRRSPSELLDAGFNLSREIVQREETAIEELAQRLVRDTEVYEAEITDHLRSRDA